MDGYGRSGDRRHPQGAAIAGTALLVAVLIAFGIVAALWGLVPL